MNESCKNCGNCGKHCGDCFTVACTGWIPEEHKITSEQIQPILDYIADVEPGNISPEIALSAIRRYIKEMFPDHFKPEQEYCCDVFEDEVAKGRFRPIKLGCYPTWEKTSGRVAIYCFNCGQKPIAPIE